MLPILRFNATAVVKINKRKINERKINERKTEKENQRDANHL